MLCRIPFKVGNYEVGCGRCKACRITRQSAWIGRLEAEALDHSRVSFWTLTYRVNPETLIYSHIQKWIKRLRRRYPKFRFFCVGEYGERLARPHWHVIVFSGPDIKNGTQGENIYTWPYGYVLAGPVNPGAYRYVAGYVLKKSIKDPKVRMSLKPGLGLGRIKMLGKKAGLAARARPFEKIPSQFTVKSKKYPLYGGARRSFENAFFKAGGSLMRIAPEEKQLLMMRLTVEDRRTFRDEEQGFRFNQRDLHTVEKNRMLYDYVEARKEKL
jgi:hypothetical protein